MVGFNFQNKFLELSCHLKHFKTVTFHTMSILSWNCQGLGNQWAVDVLSHLEREKAPKILFLMETKQSVDEMRRLQADLPYCCMFLVPSIRRSGGRALLWKEEVDLHVQTYSSNHIDALIYTDGNPT